MLVWDFADDCIISGQWISATVHSYAVSEEGDYVAISALDYSPTAKKAPRGSLNRWVSISKPPYFSAIGVWNTDFFIFNLLQIGNWNNVKKIQLSDELIALARSLFGTDEKDIPVLSGWNLTNETSGTRREIWERFQGPQRIPLTFRKDIQNGYILRTEPNHWMRESHHAEFFSNDGKLIFELHSDDNHPLWIDFDDSGRLVYADKGCLYAWKDFPEGKPTLIADLNPNKFENIPPPDWALKP
ncbi:MAG: hypothetical protein ACKVQS_02270 [Fimbriimonadaceae bacterium]